MDINQVGICLLIVSGVLSSSTCVSLIVLLPPSCKLFLRQLKLLAIVDTVGSVSKPIVGTVFYSHILISDIRVGYFVCYIENLYWWMRFTSVFIEAHIAVGVLLSWWRCMRGLELMSRSLVFLPILASVGTAVAVVLAHIRYDHGCKKSPESERFNLTFVLMCFILSFACYTLAYTRSCSGPVIVQHDTMKRTVAYPLVFLLSYGPFVYCTFFKPWDPQAATSDPLPYIVSDTCETLNGFLNATAYLLQSKKAQLALRNREANSDSIASFRVCFDPTENTERIVELSTTTDSLDRRSVDTNL